jgi:hypothetical protein
VGCWGDIEIQRRGGQDGCGLRCVFADSDTVTITPLPASNPGKSAEKILNRRENFSEYAHYLLEQIIRENIQKSKLFISTCAKTAIKISQTLSFLVKQHLNILNAIILLQLLTSALPVHLA